ISDTNYSMVTEFIFLGLSNSQEFQILLLVLFFIFYVGIVFGNLLIVITVASDSHLHSPMYFLLANLSLIDLCLSSVTAPKMIADFFSKRKVISFKGCLAQIFLVHFFGGSELVILIAMAFDRYVAICKPLRYTTIMCDNVCFGIVTAAWGTGFIHSNTSTSSLLNEPMDGANDSVVSEFVLIGLSNSWEMHLFLFWFFSVFYMGIILGNLFIVFTVIIDSHLHTPMYFLLANLSLLDLGLASTTVPKMISDLFTDCNTISFPKCMIQIFFIHVMGGVEMVLLIAMAYDRYTAICKPLHYLTIMSPKMCVSFVLAAWIVGIIHAVSQFVFVINLPFCGPNEVNSFYCDFPRVMNLACVDTYKLEFVIIANSGFISMATFFSLIISYIFILVTVWKRSSRDLSKAFVTLSAHIT
ncbi:O4F21 protein, partial [Crocuta crocuta]